MNTVTISANGTVNHIPLTPKNIGNTKIPTTINTSPLLPETIIDAFAFPIAVKYPEVTILNPLIRKANAYIFAPLEARFITSILVEVNILTSGVEKTTSIKNITNPIIKVEIIDNFMLSLTLFLLSSPKL